MKRILALGLLLANTTQTHAFLDVDQASPYHKSIEQFQYEGIVVGITQETFNPFQNITRAEFLKILFMTIDADTSLAPKKSFPDLDQSHWSTKYINTANALDLIQGNPDGNAYPNNNITYSEAIKMINVILKREFNDTSIWHDAFNTTISQNKYTPNKLLNRQQSTKLIYVLLLAKKDKESLQRTALAIPKAATKENSLTITSVTTQDKILKKDHKNVEIFRTNITNNRNYSMELVQIYDDIDSSSLSNLTLFREDKRRIIKPIPSNSIISQNGLIINPEPILLSPKQTITIIAKADINTQDRIQDFKINNTAFKFQDKYSNQVALIEKKSLGPLLSIYNPKTTIIYNPKSKETALTGTQKLFTQSFKIKPKGENANIRSITTSLESSNGASNQNIQSIHLLNSNGDILDSILSIPSGGYSLIEFTNLNIKLFKDISHTFFVAVDLRKNEANYTPPSGNIFSTKIQDVEAFGLNSGNQITQKNIQVDQSHIPDFTVHNTFPQINIQDKDPSDFQTGNQNLIDFTITNPSLTTKLHTKSIELKTFINDSATQNLSLEDIYVYSSKKELGSCSKNTSETILCNFYGPNGLQTQKSTTDDLTLRATITNFDYLSDSIKFELQQEKTSFYDEDTNTTHSVNY